MSARSYLISTFEPTCDGVDAWCFFGRASTADEAWILMMQARGLDLRVKVDRHPTVEFRPRISVNSCH